MPGQEERVIRNFISMGTMQALFKWALGAGVLALSALARAQDPASAIVGDWLVASRDAVFHIGETTPFDKDSTPSSSAADARLRMAGPREFEGRIVWLRDPLYTGEDGPDLVGKPIMDRNNSDPALRQRPLLGLRLIDGLHFDGKDTWIDGHVYNPEDGHRYRCRLSLKDRDHLRVRGYVGIPLLGGSSIWTRVEKLPP